MVDILLVVWFISSFKWPYMPAHYYSTIVIIINTLLNSCTQLVEYVDPRVFFFYSKATVYKLKKRGLQFSPLSSTIFEYVEHACYLTQ